MELCNGAYHEALMQEVEVPGYLITQYGESKCDHVCSWDEKVDPALPPCDMVD